MIKFGTNKYWPYLCNQNLAEMIESLVKSRMSLAGLTQGKLAEMSGCTASQMGIFLKGTGFLNKNSFEKTMSVLGIRLDMYLKRMELAQLAAERLRTIDNDVIKKMSKSEMASTTGIKEINCLIDVSEKEFDSIVECGIVDYEGTFPFFKSMVLHYSHIGSKMSPKSVESSFGKLAIVSSILPAVPVLGIAGMIGLATGMLLTDKKYSSLSTNALSPVVLLTKQIFKE